ncbi:hypothetical protein HMPREF3127_04485 [Sphingobacterium sp. HMSC13C05]|nr:hypothetical protein HMPREF3127_04485 [Sphingobacterium sp. HMSC13C05]
MKLLALFFLISGESYAQSNCQLFKSIIDTLSLRNNTVRVNADSSTSVPISPFSDTVEPKKTKIKIFPAKIFIEKKTLEIPDSEVLKKVINYTNLKSIKNRKFIALKNDSFKSCIENNKNFSYELLSEVDNQNFDFSKREVGVVNGIEQILPKQKIAFSNILISKDKNWAVLYAIFQEGLAKGYTSNWIIVLKNEGKQLHTAWTVYELKGFILE